ncbi:MAG: hypothetical protein K8R59_07640 [Thermoanaerobaculales bacterium]|nr:hypothetical protein [Thermoanaerobaculales bacterium]
MTKRNSGFSLGVVLVCALIIGFSFGAAMASDSLSEKESRNFWGTSPLIIPAAAFASNGLAPLSSAFNFNGFVGGGTAYNCMQAPVYLPDHARVTRLYASISDMSSSDMSVSLIRATNLSYSSTTEMARVTSNGNTSPTPTATFYGDSSITGPDISYPDYSYYVVACLPDYNFRLYQVEIDFEDNLIFRDDFEAGGMTAWSSSVGSKASAGFPELQVSGPGFEAENAGVSTEFEKSISFDSPLTIAPSEFKPDGWQAGDVFISFNDGVMYGANYTESRFMHAPVWLPDGATITDVRARVIDNDSDTAGVGCDAGYNSEIEIWLYRSKGCSSTTPGACSDEMMNASTSGASTGIQFLPVSAPTISYDVVNGQQYGYYVVMRLCGPTHEVYGVRVRYTLP